MLVYNSNFPYPQPASHNPPRKKARGVRTQERAGDFYNLSGFPSARNLVHSSPAVIRCKYKVRRMLFSPPLLKEIIKHMQQRFIWKYRAFFRADEARKAGVWNLEKESYLAKWRPGREDTVSVPKGPRGERHELTSPARG